MDYADLVTGWDYPLQRVENEAHAIRVLEWADQNRDKIDAPILTRVLDGDEDRPAAIKAAIKNAGRLHEEHLARVERAKKTNETRNANLAANREAMAQQRAAKREETMRRIHSDFVDLTAEIEAMLRNMEETDLHEASNNVGKLASMVTRIRYQVTKRIRELDA